MAIEEFNIVVSVIVPKYGTQNDRQRWCSKNIGVEGIAWTSRLNGIKDVKVIYTFFKEEHAVLFALKWL
jgi:hypothetical protein